MRHERNVRPTDRALAAFDSFWNARAAGRDFVLGEGPEPPRRPGVIAIGFGPGARFGPYTIRRGVGGGGQGQVFDAVDERLGRRCALKLLHFAMGFDAHARTRFEREGRLAARVDHPGVCRVYESGVIEGLPFLATEWVDGEPLSTWLEHCGPIPVDATSSRGDERRMIDVAIAIGEALVAAHEAGVLHRDIKPSNVLMRPDGRPIVVDFGLAADLAGNLSELTRTGQVFGTPGYMAPEQAGVDTSLPAVDARADVFALAVVTFQLLARELPFAATSRAVYESALRRRRPRSLRALRPGAATGLDVVLERALTIEPGDRLASMSVFVAELRRCRFGDPVISRPLGLIHRARRWIAREPGLAAMLGVVLVALSTALGFALSSLGEARAAAYVAGIAAAAASAERGDVASAWTRLSESAPSERNWEWGYLAGVVDPATRREDARPATTALAEALAFVSLPSERAFCLVRRLDAMRVVAESWLDDGVSPRRMSRPIDAPAGCPIGVQGDLMRVVVGLPDGQVAMHVLTGEDRIRELAPVRLIPVLASGISALAVAPDGACVAVGQVRDPLTVIEADGTLVERRIDLQSDVVRALGFVGGGQDIAVVTSPLARPSQTRLRIFARNGGEPRLEFGIGHAVEGIAPCESKPDEFVVALRGGALAFCGSDRLAPRVVVRGHDTAVRALWSDIDSDLSVVGERGSVAVFDRVPPVPFVTLRGPNEPIDALVFDDGATRLLARGRVGTVRDLSWRPGVVDLAPLPGALRLAPAGSPPMAATPLGIQRHDGVAWQLERVPSGWVVVALVGDPPRALFARPASSGALDLAVSRNGGLTAISRVTGLPRLVGLARSAPRLALLLVGGDVLRLLDVESGREWNHEAPRGATALALSDDGKTIMVGTNTGRLHTIAGDGSQSVQPIAEDSVAAIAIAPGMDRIFVAVAGSLHVVDPTRARPVLSWPLSGAAPTALSVDRSGRHLAVGREDGSVLVLSSRLIPGR